MFDRLFSNKDKQLREKLNDSKKTIFFDRSRRSKDLIIAFSGLAHVMMMPPFEFFSITRTIGKNKLLFRDTEQVYYHKGLKGETSNIDETVAFIDDFIEKEGFQNIKVVGTSAGGYAALLFGGLSKYIKEIHAFAPQTLLTVGTNFDDKYSFIDKNEAKQLNTKYKDLAEVFRMNSVKNKEINIYYGRENEVDTFHANNLAEFHSVILHSYHFSEHNIGKYLKKKGLLNNILER